MIYNPIYAPDTPRAAALLREARNRAGLSQRQLAELADTSQSAISAYEAGAREPTLPVLERMIRATGHQLHWSLETEPGPFRMADLAGQIAAAKHDRRRMRLVFEFLRSANEDGNPLLLLVGGEPAPTGHAQFDALLAAVAEDVCVRAGIEPPAWVHGRNRFLDGFWWVSDLPSARARALVNTPASYRRRGVMLDRHDLGAA